MRRIGSARHCREPSTARAFACAGAFAPARPARKWWATELAHSLSHPRIEQA